ncbi:MAG: carbon starvation CstA family protein [Rikenellaceae bacterium]
MITFIICLLLLVGAYFTYGKYVEKLFGADKNREVPSKTCYDGVDYIPMPAWKTFLIQLLNIAGLGPIFGAILGAMYGPVAFLWITFGGIFMGAVHDYFSGMISIENKGLSYPEIIGKYLGVSVKQFMRWFSIVLMVLVGAVFLTGPAGLLAGMTGWNLTTWLLIILAYYIVATLLPIDKIIGRIYPIFGAALLIMAFGLFGALIFGDYSIPEMSLENMHTNKEALPIFPTLFITIACGALSGFHATQSPLMARCMTNEKQGRPIFYGAMISESIIALIWAAIAMAFFGGVEALNTQLLEHGSNAAWAVDVISKTTLGKIGGILALLGVVAAPISTGDTAFRCARMIVADMFKISQKNLAKRIYICVPLFVIGFYLTQIDFAIIWRYFAWVNQTFAVVTLWAITVYLYKNSKNYFITLLPALFMTFITSAFLFSNAIMLSLPIDVSYFLATALTEVILILVKIIYLKK